jgi:lambda family phage portal protein
MRYIGRRRVLRSYLAANKTGPNQNWRPSNKSGDEILKKDHKLILARARDLVRNDAHVSGALRKIVNNVVFNGIRPQAALKTNDGELQRTRNNRAEAHFKRWAEAVDFYEKQELCLRHLWQDGEILAHFFYDPELHRQGIVPLGIELIECDHLDTSIDGRLRNGNYAKRGKEFNKAGRVVAYHVFPEHPGENTLFSLSRSNRIPAGSMIHVFSPERASQTRGVSWLVAAIMEIKDFGEYQNNERLAARLASAFGVFVESPYPEHQMPENHPITKASGYPGVDDISDYIDPGRIDVLPPGMKITTAKYERPGQTYEPFTKTTLKGASTGVGMSYESFSNDYADASYSAARSAALEERRGYQKQQSLLNRKFNTPIWRAFTYYMRLFDIDTLPADIPVTWQAPGWPWVDPLKDSRAAKTEIELGINTRRKLAADRGHDFDELVEQLKREKGQLEQAGITGARSISNAGF